MVPKIYTSIWLLVIAAAAGFYFTSNLNEMALTVFGFIFATLFFGFFVAVLPWLVDKQYSWNY
jgi:1,4-dihydroxy-2-naphthoate octaprenyltransferase